MQDLKKSDPELTEDLELNDSEEQPLAIDEDEWLRRMRVLQEMETLDKIQKIQKTPNQATEKTHQTNKTHPKQTQKLTIEDEKNEDEDAQFEKPSKTQLKKQMLGLQDLAGTLLKLDNKYLKQLQDKSLLNDYLMANLLEGKKIKSNIALKRHKQYLGKLLRGFDDDIIAGIEHYLSQLTFKIK